MPTTLRHSNSYSGSETLDAARRNTRSRSTPSAVNVASAEAHFSPIRSTPTAPAARGLAGAASGNPDSRTLSISTGQSVAGYTVRNRHVSPRTGSLSSGNPAGTWHGTFRSGLQTNCAIAQDGTGAR